MKKNMVAELAALAVGLAFFALVIKVTGLENLLAFNNASPAYFAPFFAVSFAAFLAATYRWKFVLSGEGLHVPLLVLLKYKVMTFSINYLTPVARLGGEPFKIMLLKKQRIKSSKSFASIVIDNFVGMGSDAVVGGIILLAFFFFSVALSSSLKDLFLLFGVAAIAAVILAYLLLIRRIGLFSHILMATGMITRTKKTKLFALLAKKIEKAEYYMRQLLMRKPRSLLLALLFAGMSWPLTVLQYSFALKILGVEVSFVQILLSIVVLNFTTMLPIPGALGAQEAGQFSVFKLMGANPNAGVALSLILRLKDMIFVLLSFLLLSQEGMSVFKLLNKKALAVINHDKPASK